MILFKLHDFKLTCGPVMPRVYTLDVADTQKIFLSPSKPIGLLLTQRKTQISYKVGWA